MGLKRFQKQKMKQEIQLKTKKMKERGQLFDGLEDISSFQTQNRRPQTVQDLTDKNLAVVLAYQEGCLLV